MCYLYSARFVLLLLPQIITIPARETVFMRCLKDRCKMEQVFPRCALPFPPPHSFLPLLWDSLAPRQPSSYPGKVSSQNHDFSGAMREGGPGCDAIHRRNRKVKGLPSSVREELYCTNPSALRGGVTLMMKATAAGLESRAFSHSSPQPLCLPAALSDSA